MQTKAEEDAETVRRALLGVDHCDRCEEDVPKGEVRSDPRMENTFGEHKICPGCYEEVLGLIQRQFNDW